MEANNKPTVKALKNICEQLGVRFAKKEFGYVILDRGEPIAGYDSTLDDAISTLKCYYGGHPQFAEILASEGIL